MLMLIVLLLVPVVTAFALITWIVFSGHSDLAPFTVLLAAVLPAAYGIYHAVRYRSRSTWAMRSSYGLLGAGMLWAFMRM